MLKSYMYIANRMLKIKIKQILKQINLKTLLTLKNWVGIIKTLTDVKNG